MGDEVDWSAATWEGNRRAQHREFLALSFRQKLAIIEQLGEVAAWFAERRRARGIVVGQFSPRSAGPEVPAGDGPGSG